MKMTAFTNTVVSEIHYALKSVYMDVLLQDASAALRAKIALIFAIIMSPPNATF